MASFFEAHAGTLWAVTLVLALVIMALFERRAGPAPDAAGPVDGQGRLTVNFGLALINAAVAGIVPLGSLAAAAWSRAGDVGLFADRAIALPVAFGIALLAQSLAEYLLHRASHAMPWLWRLHRVHHSDPHPDASTALRHHPGEMLLALVCYAGLWAALALPLAAVIAAELLRLAWGFWKHAAIVRGPGRFRAVERLFVTPAMHRVHHSARRIETDSNYGGLLSLWDHLCGTYRREDEGRGTSTTTGTATTTTPLRQGLGDADDRVAGRLAAQLRLPLVRPSAAPPDGRDGAHG